MEKEVAKITFLQEKTAMLQTAHRTFSKFKTSGLVSDGRI